MFAFIVSLTAEVKQSAEGRHRTRVLRFWRTLNYLAAESFLIPMAVRSLLPDRQASYRPCVPVPFPWASPWGLDPYLRSCTNIGSHCLLFVMLIARFSLWSLLTLSICSCLSVFSTLHFSFTQSWTWALPDRPSLRSQKRILPVASCICSVWRTYWRRNWGTPSRSEDVRNFWEVWT